MQPKQLLKEEEIYYKNIGLVDYKTCMDSMIEATKKVARTKQIEIWNVEHPLTYTAGVKFLKEHLSKHNKNSLAIQYTKRGGSITLHNPGQLVVYFILPVQFLPLGLETFIRKVECAIIQTLLEFHIDSFIVPEYSGVFTKKGKIGFVGFGIKNGCIYHGIAVNVCNSLEPYNAIHSCGIPYNITRVLDEVKKEAIGSTKDNIFHLFRESLNSNIYHIFEKKINPNHFRKRVSKLQNQNPAVVCSFSLGQSYFNSKQYWQAHESWECYWILYNNQNKPYKRFLQGLIQFASGMYKVYHKVNIRGAISLLEKSREKLSQNEYTKKIIRNYNSMSIIDYINKVLMILKTKKDIENDLINGKQKKSLPSFLILSKFQNVSI